MAEQGQNQNVDINELIDQAEARFRKGITWLNQWGDQARDMMKRQPGAVLAGVAILGFATGLLLRRAVMSDEQ